MNENGRFRTSSKNKTYRKKEMLRILRKEEVIHLAHLAEKLSVSEMTARRYAAEMVEQVQLAGSHLFFRNSQQQAYSLTHASMRNVEKKKAIGRLAASLIKAEESVFIDCGTTTPFIASNIDPHLPLTVVCCSFNICSILNKMPSCKLLMTGGTWQQSSQVFSGKPALTMLAHTPIDKAFISAAGIDPEQGLGCFHHYEGEIKQQVIRTAKKVFIVADSSKLHRQCPAPFAKLADADALITDRQLLSTDKEWLKSKELELFLP